MTASSQPPWVDWSDERQQTLLLAGTRLFAVLALQLACRTEDPQLGDWRIHAKEVLVEFPWMAHPLSDLLLLARRVREGGLAEDGEDPEAALDGAQSTLAAAPNQPGPPPRELPEAILGSSGTTAQFAALGKTLAPDGTTDGPESISVYLDTNGADFFSLSGGTGSGKTSTMGAIIEAVSQHIPNLTHNRRLQCVVSIAPSARVRSASATAPRSPAAPPGPWSRKKGPGAAGIGWRRRRSGVVIGRLLVPWGRARPRSGVPGRPDLHAPGGARSTGNRRAAPARH